ncbi:hypothetical protein H8K38_02345 [Undibacterium sp. FT79W]|nr:hypothetical protein [Undibacterium sp. FT79W]
MLSAKTLYCSLSGFKVDEHITQRSVFICHFLEQHIMKAKPLIHRKSMCRIFHKMLMIYHNHPSGSCEPSDADVRLTQTLKQALALVDVRVLDHFIIANPDVYSFAEHGLL